MIHAGDIEIPVLRMFSLTDQNLHSYLQTEAVATSWQHRDKESSLLKAWRAAMWRIGDEDHEPPEVHLSLDGTVRVLCLLHVA